MKPLEIGEKVIITDGPKKDLFGKEGLVLRFAQYAVDRLDGRVPGIYENRSTPVLLVNGEEVKCPDWLVTIERPDHGVVSYADNVRIADLPKTPLWEWDIALDHITKQEVVVCGVHYHTTDSDDGKYSFTDVSYSVSDDRKGAIRSDRRGKELDLRKRGPIWSYWNKVPYTYVDLAEEVELAFVIRSVDEIWNPSTGSYAWEKEDAIRLLKESNADFFYPSYDKGRVSVWVFTDRALGERSRRAQIFANTVRLP